MTETEKQAALGPDAASAAPTPRRRRRALRLTKRDRVLLIVLLGIPLLADLAFVWFPAVTSVVLSFTSWNGVGAIQPWVGTQEYKFAFTVDPQFWPAVLHNIIWVLVFGLIATPLGMLFAVILDRNLKGSRIYQSVFFLPVMLSLALIGIIWELMYSQNYGLINTLLGRTGSDAINWIGNPDLNLWAVLVAASWRQVGYVMILYLAGLKGVDASLREAAQIDGANPWQTFWRVIFPVLKPINIVIIVITVIESLRAYDIIYIMSHGTVLPGLELLSMLVTQYIIGQTTRIGYGSALATVLLVIALVPIIIFLVQSFRKDEKA
ncbi:carbohydrate ABC transporter permease [Humibacter ginsenosidimutans]|uniref:Sugar ABC transporter permease n=1 Tax=Humibacter ginsenosidimutans TaxID=2599293 RepID=A0A5B8M128_9MICO|nr:sugar ABC transporter permease [Humibacter ginsenosidimutans]QDZ14518.1 sugar ABC transporter permease [Humibacter ginsenosidimutans]